ncbi:MAG TPA: VOC family protein [Planctomycetota bacterium]
MNMARLKGIQHLRVFTFPAEWADCVAFYGDTLGLRLRSREEKTGVAVFSLGGKNTLSVERANPKDREEKKLVGRFVGVSIGVDDILRAYKELSAAGVMFDGAPQAEAWGGSLTHFRDPAGNVLSLVQNAARG